MNSSSHNLAPLARRCAQSGQQQPLLLAAPGLQKNIARTTVQHMVHEEDVLNDNANQQN